MHVSSPYYRDLLQHSDPRDDGEVYADQTMRLCILNCAIYQPRHGIDAELTQNPSLSQSQPRLG